MTTKRATLFVLFVLCSATSIVWGFAVVRAAKKIIIDFDSIYMGSSTVLHRLDPYDRVHVGEVYRVQRRPPESPEIARDAPPPIVSLQVYLPTAFLCVAPFALLPLTTAHLLWISVSAITCTLAAFLIWTMAEKQAPAMGFYLISFMLANCGVLFAGGNAAGPAVGLCIIGAWCFLRDRLIVLAIVCMAISLALKPHDSGLIWLYFFLIGGIQRKRALWSLALTLSILLVSAVWITTVSPHWIPELSANLASLSQRGGVNDPGPTSVQIGPGMVIDLQSVFSVFYDVPRFYNAVAYGIVGIMLTVWLLGVVRARFSVERAYLGIAAVSCMTMLPSYHRPYDARLILLTIPACALLLSEGRRIGRIALALNSLAFFLVSDLPLAALAVLFKDRQGPPVGIASQLSTIALFRPVPIVLLALSLFYLTVFWQRAQPNSRLPLQLDEESSSPAC